MRLADAFFLALIAALVAVDGGCAPTLSRPRGDVHIEALANADRHYHHGRMLSAIRAYGEAARSAERRVDRDEAEYRQAKALVRVARLADALATLDRVAARRPVSRRTVRALFDASLLRVRLGQHDAGLQGLRAVVEEHPESGLASRALWLLLADSKRRVSAQAALRTVLELEETLAGTSIADDLLAAEAELRLAGQDRAGARRALERIVAEHPYPHGQRWDDTLWRLADMDEEDGSYAEAARHLSLMLSVVEQTAAPGSYILPRMPAAALRLARLHRDRLQDTQAAAQAFEAVYTSFPTSRWRDDALVELGEMWLRAGRAADGCLALRRVLREFDAGTARRQAEQRAALECR